AADVVWLQAVEQATVADAAALQRRMQAVVDAGGEGLMLHHRDSRYRAGRSDGVLKLKPFQDAEARVVGYTEGRGKYTGMLGALVVERADGLRFRIGSGLTDALRANPPPVGVHVTYRYNGYTAAGVPRFARFLRIRHDPPPPDP
ncbi:MAG TPA: DNA ligase, partial [Candidatus Luteimonas excrementigallinarum]|nr:DNA ligase [Candidatus Luteimonas excrementigallinarum]